MHVLTQQTIPAYLTAKGLLEKGEPLEITHIPSNVNHVYRVSTSKRTLIVKQAMDTMALFPGITLDTRRTIIEHDAIRLWKRIAQAHGLGHLVPNVAHFDEGNNVLILAAAPENARLLTQDLLDAKPRSATLKRLMSLLARVHNHTFQNKALAKRYASKKQLEALQFNFYHQHMFQEEKNERVKQALHDLMSRTRKNAIALVHGDTNPKNVLVFDNDLMLIDYECAHYGDPAFDIAKIMAHYFLCSLINYPMREKYFAAMHDGWQEYQKHSIIPFTLQLKKNVIQHFGPLLWGRAFGKANIPFLDERLKQCICGLSRRIVVSNYTELEDIFKMANGYQKELKNLPKVDVASAMKQVLF